MSIGSIFVIALPPSSEKYCGQNDRVKQLELKKRKTRKAAEKLKIFIFKG